MFSYLIHRLLIMIPTLLVISVLVFVIIQLPPGDFLSNQMDELKAQGESAAALAKIEFYRELYSLDKPLIQQYAIWMGFMPGPEGYAGMLQGEWGMSFEHNLPVSEVIGDRMALTMLLNFSTIIFIYIVAFPIGVYSATRQYSVGDYGFTFIGYIGLATPNFLLGLVLLYYFNVYFGISIGGLMDPEYLDQPWSWGKVQSIVEHLAVPVIVIGTAGTAAMIRKLRANLLDELQKQYVVTARAKGLGTTRLLIKYPIRMALNPFVADIGNLIPSVVSGSVIVSAVLSLPTVGPTLLDALRSQDQYLAGSFLMFLALLTVVGVFISDLLLAMLDPRIRLGGGTGR
ncbi:ABC transporter permease [Oceanibacterium hippocampi]|uniref:Dipeptide transport system permease protein DppB n=1 Tax=Oceanibacterium hippocampi TaxID=745714 RepID=A0A1Y5RQ73_9PROT|nr:ABC transporter permease [Oceanibacterium hippocampi]SLN20065.1 Dipeptide transport system permease protein DppB [Oceanibacterium hippocampi]